MKFYFKVKPLASFRLYKVLLTMKLIAIITIAALSNVSALSYSQSVTLKAKNASIREILLQIEDQTGYHFLYDNKDITGIGLINVDVGQVTLEAALDACFRNLPLSYRFFGKTIVLKRTTLRPVNNNLPFLQSVVRGRVTGTNGEPLSGVSVMVKGTSRGTTTDTDGRYSIEVLEGILVFTYVGFAMQEMAVNKQTEVNVVMEPAETELNAVVVTALGINREKKALAYSVSEVEGEELTQAREVNVANSLSGKVAGVNVSGNATGPGGSSRVIIRGNGSLAGNNQPLYVVNGMPIDNTIPGGGTESSGGGMNIDRGDGIAGINPDDIETISVLKGGAAAALYGSRASNGVILITTKKGRAQKGIGVTFNSTSTFETPSLYPDWQYEYGQGIDGVKPQTAEQARSSGRLSFGAKMDGQPAIQLDGEMRPYSPVYVKDNINNFYRTGATYTNTVAFNGGSEAINFRFSLSNMEAKAVLPNSSINRKIANLSLNASLGQRLGIEAVGQYNIEKGANRPKVGYADHNPHWATYLIANTMDIRTLAPGYDENFNEMLWNASSAATNPYFVINRYRNNDMKNRFIGQLNVTFDILDNLFIKAGVSQDYSNFNAESIVPTGTAAAPKGSMERIGATVAETNSLLTLNYSNEVAGSFNYAAMIGGNLQKSVYDETRINGSEFTIPFYYSYTNVASLTTIPNFQQSKINSIFGSLDLDYKSIAFLSLTARQDWFSTLSPQNNRILYPSIGGSLVLSQMLDLPSFITFLKLRGSWAQVGGATPEPYILNQTYSMVQGGHGGRPVQSISSRLVTNPDLRPLTSTTYEAGLDLQLFDNRLGLDFTFYDRRTTDDIVRATISNTSGYTEALLNVGEVSNRGVEVLLTGRPVRSGNFLWNVSYNVAYNDSEIVKLTEGIDGITVGTGVSGGVIRNVVGRPYGTVWGFMHKKDAEGQTVFNTTSNLQVISELMELGVGVPPLTMGLTNEFSYRRFSLNVLLDGKFGNTIWSNTNWYASRFGLPKSTLPGREDGLALSGVDEQGNPYSYVVPVEQIDNYYNAQQSYTGLFAYDGSFVKLRQVIFGYDFPPMKFGSLRASLVARNPLILYRKTENFDPESSNTSDNAQGLEAFGLPRTRSFGVNLQLSF